MPLPRSPRFLTTLAVSTGIACAGLVGAQAGVAATRACDEPRYPNTNPGGYFTSLQVTGVTCKSGRSLALAYYRCRVEKGGRKGTCHNKTVNGLRCTESRPAESQTAQELNARVTCKSGSKKVVHTYQQNLR